MGPSPHFSTPPVLPQPRWQQGQARLGPGGVATVKGLRNFLQLIKTPSVLQNGKLGRVGVPGQCPGLLKWDSVLNLHPQLPFLISSLSPSPGDISSLHRACRQLNPRPDVGGIICNNSHPTPTPGPYQLLDKGLPRRLARVPCPHPHPNFPN